LTGACAASSQVKVESAPETPAEGRTPAPTAAEDSPSDAEQTSSETPQAKSDQAASSATSDDDDATSSVRYKATLIDQLTAGGTAYIIDYPNSGPMVAANTSCAEKAAKAEQAAAAEDAAKAARARAENATKPDEPAKPQDTAKLAEAAEAAEAAREEKVEAVRAECLKQERAKFQADVLRFRRNGSDHIQLVISRRDGSAVKELSVTQVELKRVSSDTVRVEIKEAGLGQRPIMKDRNSFDVKVPNGYSIEIEDPRLGKLPYIAKVGFVAN
jgi:hypothetical protein